MTASGVALAPPRHVPGTVTASSVLAPEDALLARFLFDGHLDFGWAEDATGPGPGQSFTLTLEPPVELVALELWNGCQRSEDHFRKDAHAKQLSVSVEGGPGVSLAASGAQRLPLPSPLKGRVWTVKVDSVYPGKRYQDLVLSELRLVDARGRSGCARPRRRPTRRRCGPGSRTRRWARWSTAPGMASARRRSTTPTEVFEGAWVMKQGSGPWFPIELFGRRQRIERLDYVALVVREAVLVRGKALKDLFARP